MGQETSKPKLTCRLSEVSYLDIEELVAIYRGKRNNTITAPKRGIEVCGGCSMHHDDYRWLPKS